MTQRRAVPVGAILKAVRQAKGSRRGAATILELSPRTLYRRIDELQLWRKIDRLCTDRGFRARKGRARKWMR